MGFGLLVIGYIMLFNFPIYGIDVFPDLLGYILMWAALRKLSLYHKFFRVAKYIAAALMPLGTLTLAIQIVSCLSRLGYLQGGAVDWTLNVLLPALELFLAFIIFVYHYYLLIGIRALAQEVELPKIARKVKRNWILTILYYVLTLIGIMTGYAGLTERFPYLMYLNPLLALFGVLWIVLNTIQIYSCYMWICLPGQEDITESLPWYRRKKTDEPTPEELKALEEKQRREYDAEMKRRQEERTKKKKRGKGKTKK